MREENRTAIKESGFPVIYLHADAQTLHDRIYDDPQTQTTRPSLTHLGGSVDEVKELLTKRLPIYREICTHEIDVANLSIKEAADRIVEMMNPR